MDYKRTTVPCEPCGGTGKGEYELWTYEQKKMVCPTCQGSGQRPWKLRDIEEAFGAGMSKGKWPEERGLKQWLLGRYNIKEEP